MVVGCGMGQLLTIALLASGGRLVCVFVGRCGDVVHRIEGVRRGRVWTVQRMVQGLAPWHASGSPSAWLSEQVA